MTFEIERWESSSALAPLHDSPNHAVAPAPTLQVTQCARHDSEMHERRSNTRELPSPPALLLVTGPVLLIPLPSIC